MLRITVQNNAESVTFQLEGKLAGPWVRVVENCWRSTLASGQPARRRVDLKGVTFIDAAGKEILAVLHAQGAELIAAGCLTRAIVAEIQNASHTSASVEEKARFS
jgi:hypothetical protein